MSRIIAWVSVGSMAMLLLFSGIGVYIDLIAHPYADLQLQSLADSRSAIGVPIILVGWFFAAWAVRIATRRRRAFSFLVATGMAVAAGLVAWIVVVIGG